MCALQEEGASNAVAVKRAWYGGAIRIVRQMTLVVEEGRVSSEGQSSEGQFGQGDSQRLLFLIMKRPLVVRLSAGTGTFVDAALCWWWLCCLQVRGALATW